MLRSTSSFTTSASSASGRLIVRPKDRATSFARFLIACWSCGRVSAQDARVDISRLEEQFQGRLSQRVSRQGADAFHDFLAPSLERRGQFIGPKDISSIGLDEVLVLVEPVGM